MNYDPDVFVIQFPIAKRFVYHLVYYRALRAAYQDYGLECEFWTHTIDAHLLQAAILWCMIFGADGCNPTHWKNVSEVQLEELKSRFREGLAKATGIDWPQWEQYWKDMTEFRNKYAAHRELAFDKPPPIFDIALKVAYYYDSWIRKVITPDILEEPPLRDTAAKLRDTVTPLVEQLVEHTKIYYDHAEPNATPEAR